MHLLAAVTHVPGIVIGQDGHIREGGRDQPLQAAAGPAAAGRDRGHDGRHASKRDNSLFVRKVKKAHYLWPILGNQPKLNQTLNALPWETTPVAAATSEISRGRIETRTIRVLPAPEGAGFQDARQALLIERYVTYKKKGQWRTRAESVLYLTSLAADEPRRKTCSPTSAATGGLARPLATRRDLERRQIAHPHRERTPGLVRHHQPGHHPVPHTRSNQLHRRNPPYRSGPPPRTPAPRPHRPFTRLNTARDFDESLHPGRRDPP